MFWIVWGVLCAMRVWQGSFSRWVEKWCERVWGGGGEGGGGGGGGGVCLLIDPIIPL